MPKKPRPPAPPPPAPEDEDSVWGAMFGDLFGARRPASIPLPVAEPPPATPKPKTPAKSRKQSPKV